LFFLTIIVTRVLLSVATGEAPVALSVANVFLWAVATLIAIHLWLASRVGWRTLIIAGVVVVLALSAGVVVFSPVTVPAAIAAPALVAYWLSVVVVAILQLYFSNRSRFTDETARLLSGALAGALSLGTIVLVVDRFVAIRDGIDAEVVLLGEDQYGYVTYGSRETEVFIHCEDDHIYPLEGVGARRTGTVPIYCGRQALVAARWADSRYEDDIGNRLSYWLTQQPAYVETASLAVYVTTFGLVSPPLAFESIYEDLPEVFSGHSGGRGPGQCYNYPGFDDIETC
jgi:hypothetical protein